MAGATGSGRTGRPVDLRLREAVLASTGRLLAERGYDRVTMEEIAADAGAAKQTLYRIWGSKAEVVADTVLRGAFVLEVAPIPDTGDLRDDLRVWLSGIAAYLAEPGMRSVVRALATASTGSRDRGDAFERVVVGPVAQPVVDRIGHARAAGERAPEASAEAVVDLIVGYLTLASIGRAPLDPARIGELVDVLIPAAG